MKLISRGRYVVGFDLGGTKMMAAVFDRQFNVASTRRKRSRDGKGMRRGMRRIIETIEEVLQVAGVKHRQLSAIGIGCPGMLDLNRGVIVHAPNLGWRNVPVARVLQRHFGCRVVIANDVDAGAYGEYRFGAARGARCALGVFLGTGVGGGLVYEGKLFRGRVHSCMELGHVHLQPKGRLCGCGRRGCLETVASRLAIAGEAAVAAYRGQTPRLLEAAGTDVAAIRSGVLAAAIEGGDDAVEQIVRSAAKELGVVVASLVNLLAPDVVVLGGGLTEAMPRIFLPTVRSAVRRQAVKAFRGVKIVEAELGDDAGVFGAAALAAERAS